MINYKEYKDKLLKFSQAGSAAADIEGLANVLDIIGIILGILECIGSAITLWSELTFFGLIIGFVIGIATYFAFHIPAIILSGLAEIINAQNRTAQLSKIQTEVLIDYFSSHSKSESSSAPDYNDELPSI